MVVRVCILDVIHFVIILCVAEIFISIPTNTENPGEGGGELCTNFGSDWSVAQHRVESLLLSESSEHA